MKKIIVIGTIVLLVVIIGGAIFYTKRNTTKIIEQTMQEFDSGDVDAAIISAQKLLKSNPNDIDALLVLAATYAQKGSITFKEEENAKLAIEYAQKALLVDPNNSEAYRIIGYAYEIQEKYEDAHINYDKAISLNPNNSLALSNKGHAYDLQGDLTQAESLYKKALEVMPANEHALLNLARIQVRQEKYDDARETIDNLISVARDSHLKADGYQLSAYIAYTEQDFDLATTEIEKSISFNSKVPQSWVLKAKIDLGTALDMETEQELRSLIARAREDIKKALEINPNQASAYQLLSEIEIITGDKTAQVEMKKRALEAVELDITLGKSEKDALRSYLNASIIIQKN